MSSAALTGAASSGLKEVELPIRGMTCTVRAVRIEKNRNAIDDVLGMVNFATEKAPVTAPASIPGQPLIEQIEQAGYGAKLAVPAGRRPEGPARDRNPVGAAGPEEVPSCPG
jgi:P-type Cu+ transporter